MPDISDTSGDTGAQFRYSWPQSTYFHRDETGVSVSAHSAGAYTATVLVRVNVMRGGGRAPPTLTSQDQFYPHHWMYARKQRLQLCVLCATDSGYRQSMKVWMMTFLYCSTCVYFMISLILAVTLTLNLNSPGPGSTPTLFYVPNFSQISDRFFFSL